MPNKLAIAKKIAQRVHGHQVDKKDYPYLAHVYDVAQRVNEYGKNHYIVGLLHDAIEDSCNISAEFQQEIINEVKLNFDYIAFNANTIESLESTGDMKLLPEKIRNLLIELKRKQDLISSRAKGNYGNYLNGYEKADQLGFRRIQYSNPSVKDLDIEKNIPVLVC